MASIPTHAYLVSGKRNHDALYSASHGVGLVTSRQKAKDSMAVSAIEKMLINADVTLIAGQLKKIPWPK